MLCLLVLGQGELCRTAKFGRDSVPDRYPWGLPAPAWPGPAPPLPFPLPGLLIDRRLRPATPPVSARGAFVGPTGAGLAGRRPPHLTWRLRGPKRPAPPREINGPRPLLHPSPPPRPNPGSRGREGYRAGGPLSPSALAQLLSAPPPPPDGGCRRAGSEGASVCELPLHFLPPAAAAPPVPGIPSGQGNCEGRDDGGAAGSEATRGGGNGGGLRGEVRRARMASEAGDGNWMRRPGSSRGLTRARGSVKKGIRVRGGKRLWRRTAEPAREAQWASEGAGACGGSREGASTVQPPPSAPAAAAAGPPPPPTTALLYAARRA